jgi:hypothetical protein
MIFKTVSCTQFMVQQKVFNAVGWQKVLSDGRKYNTESDLYIQAAMSWLSFLCVSWIAVHFLCLDGIRWVWRLHWNIDGHIPIYVVSYPSRLKPSSVSKWGPKILREEISVVTENWDWQMSALNWRDCVLCIEIWKLMSWFLRVRFLIIIQHFFWCGF